MRRLMEAAGSLDFDAADEVVHDVKSEWHYPILSKFGYEPQTDTGTGFVRSYIYRHPASGHEMRLATGVNSDYWEDVKTRKMGYWGTLEDYLNSQQNNGDEHE